MTWYSEFIGTIRQSAAYKSIVDGTVATGMLLLIMILILMVMLCVTFLLRQFFKHHPVVNRAHKLLIYLLTMAGVVALFIAGIIGILLPVIPGVIFIFVGLLLMRKYHRWAWMDMQMARLRRSVKKTDLGSRFYAWRARRHRLREQRRKERLQEKLNKARKRRSRQE
jgi:hypothetical protein